jgi:hypothetical protein
MTPYDTGRVKIGIAHTRRQPNGDAIPRHAPEPDYGFFIGVAWAIAIEAAIVVAIVVAWHLWARFA